LHCTFAVLLFKNLNNKPSAPLILSIIRDAVEAEKEFITGALPYDLKGMNKTLMSEYIEFVADRLLTSLGCPKFYGTMNPFEWMELISLEGKTNFFERRVGEYSRAGINKSGSGNLITNREFVTTEDF
jgi:ribonucleotide reductase beta subunit family protein with ferritin-like domain